MGWRIVNGCATHPLVVRPYGIAPEFIFYGLVTRAINKNVCLKRA
jgi:hypothetical protein